MNSEKYETVIGLEVHAQLLTHSKAFSGDKNEFGSPPNTNISPITMGHPGTLPKMNKSTYEHAIRLGLACESNITEVNQFSRKNYFYADLPKGYQITQDDTPICTGGVVRIKLEDGTKKTINLTRIHMEEDSGKSIHDQSPFDTLIDLNRAGVPLLELVSEPELRSAEEAYQYLTEVRKLVRYLDVCDGNMEEGSLRCDANISVRLRGAKEFGKRVEVKNMNSIRNVHRAIEHEVARQIECVETGQEVLQETRSFNAADGTTTVMRTKEGAHDYRYFPEPDLQPLIVTQQDIDRIRETLPPLPGALFKKYTEELQLSEYDAGILTDSKPIALYFEKIIAHTTNYKAAVNWLMGDIKSYLNEQAITMEDFQVAPRAIADLIQLIDDKKVSNNLAAQKIFPALLAAPAKSPLAIAEENNWLLEENTDALAGFVAQAIEKHPEKVQAYKAGNKNLLGLFMGEVMKMSKGTADPQKANQLIREMLDK